MLFLSLSLVVYSSLHRRDYHHYYCLVLFVDISSSLLLLLNERTFEQVQKHVNDKWHLVKPNEEVNGAGQEQRWVEEAWVMTETWMPMLIVRESIPTNKPIEYQ
jgi:hypothetical protein